MKWPTIYLTVPDGEAEPVWPATVTHIRRFDDWLIAIFESKDERDHVLWEMGAKGYEVLAGETLTLVGAEKNPNG